MSLDVTAKVNQAPEEARPDTCDYHRIFASDLPLLDLRAPVEFARGAFEQAVNIPLMTDDERAAVGTCYKEQGQQAAITLGHQLVSGKTRAGREQAWQEFIGQHPQGYLYCFRGGLRSRTVQAFLKEAGVHYPLVKGGYKALRQYLLDQLIQLSSHPLVILGGKTGCNKTDFIASRSDSLDLEGAAGHRGSSFGGFAWPQSTQITFENKLAQQYIRRNFAPGQRILLEDEGRVIGSVHVPHELREKMLLSPVVVVEESFEFRLEQLFNEYIVKMVQDFVALKGEEPGRQAFSEYFHQGVFKVRKRLGMQRYQALLALLEKATSGLHRGELNGYLDVLRELMVQYYDPMYDYQLGLKKERIVFRGNSAECRTYLDAL
ncbi:tRNA 2-selenouridine(34) synthase MnmH [Thalassomonas viridans]|uniref:tRNA 2-selenouridine synthase n=1 Tax=Thalassomonas viridans TaxID=137584 RepID=A0AAE9Z240_9GAMM|nr:tRNA 2-selenouridine(34) synthase MnmH [Thalassomonas viridans]WDE03812.1 tRNA 2-selenouridine(34) synthase MnmH [Thalassomonas viridans]